MFKYFAFVILLAGSVAAQVSNGVTSSGTITPGDCASFSSQNRIQDAGGPCGTGTGNVSGSGLTSGQPVVGGGGSAIANGAINLAGGTSFVTGILPNLNLPTTLTANTSGNAATATALASLPTLCSTGQAATGIVANGNATGCAVFGNLVGTSITTSVGGLPIYPTGVANTVATSTAYVDATFKCLPYTAGTDIGTCINFLTTNNLKGTIDLRGLPTAVYINSPMVTPSGYLLTAAAAGTGVYTGTFPAAANALAGLSITITGFGNGANNGTFNITASTSTTITTSNAASVSQSTQPGVGTIPATSLFTGKILFGCGTYFFNNVTGMQTFGAGVTIEGCGRSSNGATGIPYNNGSGTDFEACSPTDTASADYTAQCASTPYSASLTADTFNYPAAISLNGYLASAGAVGTSGSTALAARVSGITVGCGMLANTTGFANYSAQEGSKFDNFYPHDCSAAGDIPIDIGGGTGGAQNSWYTDYQVSTLSGKTSATSAVGGIRIWNGSGNGFPNLVLKGSVVNNSGGPNPNHCIEIAGGATGIGQITFIGKHEESCTIDGFAIGVATVKGTDQGVATNGVQLIGASCGPGFGSGANSGCAHIYSNANLAGAFVTNTLILGLGATCAGSAPTYLINDENNTPIPCSQKFEGLYLTDGTSTGGKTIQDSSFTNTVPFNGAQFPTSANGVSTNASKQLVASTAHNTSAPLVCAAASGSGSAYTCSTAPTFAPADGDLIIFQADVASAGAVTLVVNGQAGTPAVQKAGGSADPIVVNDFRIGGDYLMEFDGTNWQLLSATGNDPTNATNLTSGNVAAARLSNALASPPAIGGTAPAAGTFTTLTYTSLAAVNAHVSNVTAVTVSNPTAATDTILMALSLPASYFVTVGQPYAIHGSGVLSTTAASVPLVTITPKLCSVAGCATGTVTPLAAIQSAALNTTALTNATWVFNAVATVASTGASCNLIVKGTLVIETGASAAAADSIYADSNIATSSPNQTCTNALFLDFFVQQSTTGASNSYKQLMGVISPLP